MASGGMENVKIDAQRRKQRRIYMLNNYEESKNENFNCILSMILKKSHGFETNNKHGRWHEVARFSELEAHLFLGIN